MNFADGFLTENLESIRQRLLFHPLPAGRDDLAHHVSVDVR